MSPPAHDPVSCTVEHRPPRELPDDILCIDTGFLQPELAASYLMGSGGRYAFVETGTALGVPHLLATLDARGIDRAAVDYVIPTHVHLDHAGGAGSLMAALPNARLVIHPRGARHMIDPAKLWAGATAVYGAEVMRTTYGEAVPVAAERVIEAPDGFELDFNGRVLKFIDTPGHAYHHFCVWDERSRGFFTGDTFGMSLRTFDTDKGPFVYLPSAPTQFDPQAWHASLERMMAFSPVCMYPTHYSRIEQVERLADDLHHLIEACVELALENAGNHGALRNALAMQMAERLHAHGSPFSNAELFARIGDDIEVNAQGLEAWLMRRESA
ncbi:MAG: MBL fold metallo-hydrolase [Proteobacteria bacterium]|nr:MAG: MBL fold metallo-hydrolase [Pseudomonadota bacterium]